MMRALWTSASGMMAQQLNMDVLANNMANVNTVGTGVQLVTNGAKVTEYRPSDNDKAVDILVRFPPDRRSLDQIDDLHIQTPSGHVPIGNFVSEYLALAPAATSNDCVDAREPFTLTVRHDTSPGTLMMASET